MGGHRMSNSAILQAISRSFRGVAEDYLVKLIEELIAVEKNNISFNLSPFSIAELLDNVEAHLSKDKISSKYRIRNEHNLLRNGDFKRIQTTILDMAKIVAIFSRENALSINAEAKNNSFIISLQALSPKLSNLDDWDKIISFTDLPANVDSKLLLHFAVSFKILSLLGAKITFISIGDILIEIPLSESSLQDIPHPPKGRILLLANNSDPQNKRIQTYLKNWGLDYSVADKAVTAIRELIEAIENKQSFNTIIFINDPGDITTKQVIDILKSLPELADIGIILLSSRFCSDVPKNTVAFELPITQSNLFDCLIQTMIQSQNESTGSDKMEDVLNRNHINELLEDFGNEDFVDLLRAFLAETYERVQVLQEIANKGDLQAVEHEAHTLKGSAANLGLAYLSEKAAAVVVACREERLKDIVPLVALIPEALAISEKAAQEFLNFE